jgi:hypothetical protein
MIFASFHIQDATLRERKAQIVRNGATLNIVERLSINWREEESSTRKTLSFTDINLKLQEMPELQSLNRERSSFCALELSAISSSSHAVLL